MRIIAHFVPEIEHDDPLRYPIPPAIDKYFIQGQFFSYRGWLRVNDLYIAIVPLVRLGNVDGSSTLLRDAALRLKNLLCMIWTHPFLSIGRHGRKGWVKAIEVPVKIAIVAG